MKAWEAYAGNSKLGGKPVTGDIVFRSFSKSNIKACELQKIFKYAKSIRCTGNCTEHLRRYLENEVGEDEGQTVVYNEVNDEFGEKQLRLW